MTENVLVTRGLSKRYGSHPAVAHADITLRKGEIYGLVGRNVPRYEQKTLSIT